jgi:pyrimidine-nucleoside phosphorylase
VLAGEPIASVFAKDAGGVTTGLEALAQAIVIGDKLTEKPLPLVSHRVTRAGVEELTLPPGPASRAAPRG